MKYLFLLAAAALAMPAQAQWQAANPQVAEAAKDPRVAAALAAQDRVAAAIVAGDKASFIDAFAADALVHNPSNSVADRAATDQRFQSGLIAYEYLRRSIEHAVARGGDEVVLMGEESYRPKAGSAHAGKVVRRRFTDLWRLQGGRWKLSLRQATIVSVE